MDRLTSSGARIAALVVGLLLLMPTVIVLLVYVAGTVFRSAGR